MRDFAREWMWSEAVEMIARAERMHRSFFRPSGTPSAWEPPADILETEREVLVIVALPGVPNETIHAGFDDGHLVVSGTRLLPAELHTATIHRLELPQGRFLRRLPLPPGRYTTTVKHAMVDGCLLVKLEKA
jgi:HSP20 family protein